MLDQPEEKGHSFEAKHFRLITALLTAGMHNTTVFKSLDESVQKVYGKSIEESI
jgi:hypothetical protein